MASKGDYLPPFYAQLQPAPSSNLAQTPVPAQSSHPMTGWSQSPVPVVIGSSHHLQISHPLQPLPTSALLTHVLYHPFQPTVFKITSTFPSLLPMKIVFPLALNFLIFPIFHHLHLVISWYGTLNGFVVPTTSSLYR